MKQGETLPENVPQYYLHYNLTWHLGLRTGEGA